MTHSISRSLGTTLALLLALGFTSAAPAADGNEGQASGSSSATESATQVSDGELKQFAEAYKQIQSVRMEYGQKIRKAEDKEKQAALKKEGRQDMVSAIQSSGLEIAEYRQIGKQLNGSKELQARLRELMRQQGQGSQENQGNS